MGTERDMRPGDPWSPEILEELHSLLIGLQKRSEAELRSELGALAEAHGESVYGELLYLLSHLRFPADQAREYWEGILEHRHSIQQRLGGDVDLRVALVSYFLEVNRHLENPKIIEMQLFEEERASAYRDELTGLHNFRMFREQLEREVFHSGRCSKPVSLVMLDVDHFKAFNDANGHEEGNRALQELARLLERALRKCDVAVRYGGEEFALILPCTTKTSAYLVAERTRDAIENHRFRGQHALPDGDLTVSAGVATFPADALDEGELVRRADRALYLAKAAGRNQVMLYGQSRRSYGRVSVGLEGSFRTLSDEVRTLTTLNMSESGCLFVTECKPQVGALVELKLRTDPEREVTASGRVVHVEPAAESGYRVAVHISDARNADRARLMRLVRDAAVDGVPVLESGPPDGLG